MALEVGRQARPEARMGCDEAGEVGEVFEAVALAAAAAMDGVDRMDERTATIQFCGELPWAAL